MRRWKRRSRVKRFISTLNIFMSVSNAYEGSLVPEWRSRKALKSRIRRMRLDYRFRV